MILMERKEKAQARQTQTKESQERSLSCSMRDWTHSRRQFVGMGEGVEVIGVVLFGCGTENAKCQMHALDR